VAKNTSPLEEDEQIAFVSWLEAHKLKFTAIPNSTYTKSWSQKRKNTAMGLRSGLPDLLVITPRGLLFVEMKRKQGSVTSPEQKEWIEALNKIPNVQAEVCKGADEAIKFVSRFL